MILFFFKTCEILTVCFNVSEEKIYKALLLLKKKRFSEREKYEILSILDLLENTFIVPLKRLLSYVLCFLKISKFRICRTRTLQTLNLVRLEERFTLPTLFSHQREQRLTLQMDLYLPQGRLFSLPLHSFPPPPP